MATLKTGAKICKTKSAAELAYIERRQAEYRTTKHGLGLNYRGDTWQMDPAELERRIARFESRAAAGEPLFQ